MTRFLFGLFRFWLAMFIVSAIFTLGVIIVNGGTMP